MSHYAVLVIGEDVEGQLAKFDESLEMDKYVKKTKEEIIKETRKEIEDYRDGTYAEFLKDKVKYKSECNKPEHINYLENEFPLRLTWSDEEVYKHGIRWYEPEDIGPNGEVYSTRNPLSKWDWWTIGGRYRDRFVMKKGESLARYVGSLYAESEEGSGDSAKKGDIDWSKTHQVKEDYDAAIRFWEMKIEGSEPLNEKETETLKWDWYKPEYYIGKYKTKETYATAMSNFTMWAIVIDGVWYEKGSMGWWGMSSETTDEGLDWELNFYDRFIKDLPDDTLLTVVDCHI